MSTETTGTSLAVRAPSALAVTPSSPDELFKMATWIGKSKMYSGIDTPEAAFTVMLRGMEMGIPMSVALTEIKPFDGKLSVSARLLESQAASDPEVEYFRLKSTDANQATYVAKRKGLPEIEHTFTMDDAKVAKLDQKDNWKKYPKAMLRAAASRELARIISPGKTIGLRTRDEIEAEDDPYRPEPVSPLPTASRQAPLETIDVEAVDSDGAVTERVSDTAPPVDEYIARFVQSFNDCKHASDREAVKAEASKRWGAKVPAEVMAAGKAAAERIKAGG